VRCSAATPGERGKLLAGIRALLELFCSPPPRPMWATPSDLLLTRRIGQKEIKFHYKKTGFPLAVCLTILPACSDEVGYQL
jgi:hypothetical protein